MTTTIGRTSRKRGRVLSLLAVTLCPFALHPSAAFAQDRADIRRQLVVPGAESTAAPSVTVGENHNARYHVGGHGSSGDITGPDPHFDTHGQLLFGEGPIYISHLPFFMYNPNVHPHNFQAIVEIDLAKDGADPRADYVADRREHRDERVYTVLPRERFSLTDFVAPTGGRPPLQAFPGILFRGHFERGGVPIVDDATVEVRNVVHFREFDPLARKLPELTYLLFGTLPTPFMAHLMSAPPDFDQVLSVTLMSHNVGRDELRRGVVVTFPDRPNEAEARIREGEQVHGEVRLDGAPEPISAELHADVEWYLEEGELAGFFPRPR